MHEDGDDDNGVGDFMVMTNEDSVLGIEKKFCTDVFISLFPSFPNLLSLPFCQL